MRSILRQFRRAPGRILASIFALALAVGAIGVLAIPTIAGSSLDDAVERDGLGDIVVDTTPLDANQLQAIAAIENVESAEGQVTIPAEHDGEPIRLIGLAGDRSMDLVQVAVGREPAGPSEVIAEPGLFAIGDPVEVAGETFDVVGLGSTLWWSGSDVLYGDLDTARALTADGGTDRLTITAADDGEDALREVVADVRRVIAADGDTFTEFPTYFPDGSTPIDEDISQVSQLIGLLGVFAGLVALVLLASTTNTLIAERTREVAVMRALGARQRQLRRRLRRIAMGIAAAALLVGLPFGVAISNLIARMVLEEFVGITPGFAVDIPVLIGSAVAVLVGARLVSARAARRVSKAPLATALRDRDGAPFGATRLQRLSAWVGMGGLLSRIAARTSIRRPARTVAIVVQISAAVGAAFLIPTLVASVNDYNTSAFDVWQWDARAIARDPGLPLDAEALDADTTVEAGVLVEGEVDDWQLDVYGLRVDATAIDATTSEGSWFRGADEAVVSEGFAERTGIEVGETIEVVLAAGSTDYVVTGLTDDFSRSVYVEREGLATVLGAPGMANVAWSFDDTQAIDPATPVTITTFDELTAESAEGRNAIVVIFGAIGVLVSGVAALAVLSSMTVSLFERRHEFAALQALGARRRRLRGLLAREIAPLGAVGLVLGLGSGALGARGIIASFESSNAVDIGVTDAMSAVPFIVVGTFAVLALLASAVVRNAARRPIAVSLRGAA